MLNQFLRTEWLIGKEGIATLQQARVAVFGLGGVGGHVVEVLARSGIGTLDLIDNDKISVTNLNRQILATWKTVGQYKTEAAKDRIKDINPDCKVNIHTMFYDSATAADFNFADYDYVVDAIDTVSGKLALVVQGNKAGTPVISSMGAGNKTDPSAFMVADIYETSVCPLARVMRAELRKLGIDKLKVVYSREKPMVPEYTEDNEADTDNEAEEKKTDSVKRRSPGSNAFVPAAAGIIIGGEVVKDILRSAAEK